mmetsp:Transcript_8808/g.25080  ORF Transcript_8808/g.25080 Transcript_8808/m.25080 type:complete len:237 (-) Transcript_8808:758-1468(-)
MWAMSLGSAATSLARPSSTMRLGLLAPSSRAGVAVARSETRVVSCASPSGSSVGVSARASPCSLAILRCRSAGADSSRSRFTARGGIFVWSMSSWSVTKVTSTTEVTPTLRRAAPYSLRPWARRRAGNLVFSAVALKLPLLVTLVATKGRSSSVGAVSCPPCRLRCSVAAVGGSSRLEPRRRTLPATGSVDDWSACMGEAPSRDITRVVRSPLPPPVALPAESSPPKDRKPQVRAW